MSDLEHCELCDAELQDGRLAVEVCQVGVSYPGGCIELDTESSDVICCECYQAAYHPMLAEHTAKNHWILYRHYLTKLISKAREQEAVKK